MGRVSVQLEMPDPAANETRERKKCRCFAEIEVTGPESGQTLAQRQFHGLEEWPLIRGQDSVMVNILHIIAVIEHLEEFLEHRHVVGAKFHARLR